MDLLIAHTLEQNLIQNLNGLESNARKMDIWELLILRKKASNRHIFTMSLKQKYLFHTSKESHLASHKTLKF